MTILKIALGVVLAALVALAATVVSFRMGVWAPSYEAVKAKYGGPPSQFIDVGSATLHVRDEGQGPVLILMHSSMTNLREWDAWADRLKRHYRVIRLDWPPYGLSIDRSNSYSMAKAESLLEQFVDQSHLPKFTLVGSSSGATICVLYAARHPERVDALALSTLPLSAPPPSHTDPRVLDLVWAHQKFFPNYYPKIYYDLFLHGLFAHQDKVTPALVDWYWASNTIPGSQGHLASYYKADLGTIWKKTGHGDAEKITAPVLLQWGDADPVLPPYLGESAKAQLKNAPVTLIHYKDAGHYPMLDIPEQTVADLETFLAKIYPAKG